MCLNHLPSGLQIMHAQAFWAANFFDSDLMVQCFKLLSPRSGDAIDSVQQSYDNLPNYGRVPFGRAGRVM